MDRKKNGRVNRDDEVAGAKARLCAAASRLSPLNPVRRHPLLSLGIAFAAGAAAVGMPRTRDAVVNAADKGLRRGLAMLLPAISLLAARVGQAMTSREHAVAEPVGRYHAADAAGENEEILNSDAVWPDRRD